MRKYKEKILDKIDGLDNQTAKCLILLLIAPLYIIISKKAKRIIIISLVALFGLAMAIPIYIIKHSYYSTVNTITDYSAIFAVENKRKETKKIVIHHDADESDSTSLINIYDFHKHTRGWSCGIAYHYIILKGKVYKIHDDEDVTAHTYGFNDNSVSICIHGDFSKCQPTDDNYKQIALLCIYLMKKYDLSPTDIIGHRECPNNTTECPGSYFDLEHLRNRIQLINHFI